MPNSYRTPSKLFSNYLLIVIVLVMSGSCSGPTTARPGWEKFLGRWTCPPCNPDPIDIFASGDRLYVGVHFMNYAEYEVTYNEKSDKIVCNEFDPPDILYNSSTDKIQAFGNEYSRVQRTK